MSLASRLLVSVASEDLTPPELLPLGGYTERHGALAEPGGDTLHARVEVFRSAGQTIAVASVEMLTVPDSLSREVRAAIPKTVHLFLAATHTHCAPDSQMLNDRMKLTVPGIASFKRKWLNWYATAIARAVNRALKSQGEPVEAVQIFESHPGANRGRRKLAEPDDLLTEVSARLSDRTENLIWHYAAHPVIYGPEELQTRSDWPGAIAERFHTLVLQGAIGDVSPNADGPTAADRMAQWLGRIDRAEAKRRGPFKVWPGGDFKWVEAKIGLNRPAPHPTFAKVYHVPVALAQMAVTQFAPTSASISAFRIGSLAVVGVPGEPTSHLGRRIRDAGRALGFRSVLVVSHVNGWIGYILGSADYDRGGYEATLSLYGREEGDRVVDAGIQALKELAHG